MLLNEELKKEYGAIEYNTAPEGYHNEDVENIDWNEVILLAKEGEEIQSERIRFVTDSYFPYYDLSYWHIRIKGNRYRVLNSPFIQVDKKGGMKRNLYQIVKKEFEGVFIRDLFNNISILY